jgi:hypothetical protein
MFRLARLILFVGIGFYLGFKYKETMMRSMCDAGAGTWKGSICLNSEIPT